MLNKLSVGLDYIYYLLTSATKHGVHSPFVYDFVTQVIEPRQDLGQYGWIEQIRKRMLQSDALIEVDDFGASAKKKYTKKLSSIVAQSVGKSKDLQLLQRICKAFNPEFSVELGTNVGISTLYQGSVLQGGHFFSLEGSKSFADIAKFNIEEAGLTENLTVVEGEFSETLPSILNMLPRLDYAFIDGNHQYEPTLQYFDMMLSKVHNNSIIVFHDINWSADMQRAWAAISNYKEVNVTIDLFDLGIVFFRKEQEKEHFRIRF